MSTSTPLSETLPDLQGSDDHRRIPINKVGITDLKLPIRFKAADGQYMPAEAMVSMLVSLPPERKGTHMSRFLEVFAEFSETLCPDSIGKLCETLCQRLDAEQAWVDLEFTWFMKKKAPATEMEGWVDFTARLSGAHDRSADPSQRTAMGVSAPATSLCPCSREISAYGAHNQRCEITADVCLTDSMHLEELIRILEESASCEIYSVLKRPDEKVVTEVAYENPKFVEDIVRDVACRLNDESRVNWYRVTSKNFESIHNHNAFAEIIKDDTRP
ncbi:MAG: GTP cyclohydrolase I FolE2 [Phycisphaerae bacterium]|nr:GTP cyclohydrolase I FolE2 [Phycisphaerae bacterium]